MMDFQELDGGSVNNTLHAGQPGTTALARAVLTPGGLGTPVGSAPPTPRTERGPADGSPLTPRLETPADTDHSLSISTTPPEFTRKPDGSKRGEVYV